MGDEPKICLHIGDCMKSAVRLDSEVKAYN